MWWVWTLLSVATVLGVGTILGVINTRLKTRRFVLDHARQGLELQLKRRHELIDRLLEPIQREGSFDLDSTDNVSFLARRARNTIKLGERGHFESALSDSLRDLISAVDNSPELPAIEAYAQPRSELDEVENDLRNAQRFYNDAVQQYNSILEFPPNRLIAAMFSFSREEQTEISSSIPEPQVAVADKPISLVPPPKGMTRSEPKTKASK